MKTRDVISSISGPRPPLRNRTPSTERATRYRVAFVVAHMGLMGCAPGDDAHHEAEPRCVETAQGSRCYTAIDGLAVVEGDIIIGELADLEGVAAADDTFRAFWDSEPSRAGRRWPGSTVPYVIAAGFQPADTVAIESAISEYAAHGIRFVPHSGQADYVVFTPVGGDSCTSYAGRIGGPQPITLVVGAAWSCVVHEMGHALGLAHEQSRIDRDAWITIHPQNMAPHNVHIFDALPGGEISLPYDVASVMHYSWNAYSSNGQPTITRHDGSTAGLEPKYHLSPGDANALRYWYGRECKPPIGDFNGDGRADVVSKGGYGWATTPVWLGTINASFTFANAWDPALPGLSAFNQPGVQSLLGDFDGDGRTDVVEKGGGGWGTTPVYFSNGDGTFRFTNAVDPSGGIFNYVGAQTHAGDFDGDGRTDLLMRGASGWTSTPLFLSNGDGSFRFVNAADPAGWLFNVASAQPFVGDFNGDGRSDLLLRGAAGWTTTPVYLADGQGSFTLVNAPDVSTHVFNAAGVETHIADVDGDGRDDVILKGGGGWTTIPVFHGNADGTFGFSNPSDPSGLWNVVGPEAVVGDFNGDGRADLTMRNPGWTTTPVFTSQGAGNFSFSNAASPSAFFNYMPSKAYPGDVNGDGRTDIVLKGGTAAPSTIVLIGQGGGVFQSRMWTDPAGGLFNASGVPTPCF